jgi:ribosomal protein S18 acetylase RimI-like enzyme
MLIKKAIPADITELNVLINTAYRGDESKKGWTTEAHLLDGNRIDEATLQEYLDNPEVTILKYTDDADQKIKASVYLQDKGTTLYLGMLSVQPTWQATGIGRLLLNEAEVVARQINKTSIEISVISTRTELIAWYVRRGFEATGEVLPFHVDRKFGVPREQIELIIMTKTI